MKLETYDSGKTINSSAKIRKSALSTSKDNADYTYDIFILIFSKNLIFIISFLKKMRIKM